jgi:hypothetical protein
MARTGYTVLVDEDTGELLLVKAGAKAEQHEEIGPVVQRVIPVDLAGNLARNSANGSAHVSIRDTELKRGTWAQLTAAGTTDAITTTGYTKHTITVTIASIDTTVDVRIEGKIYGGTWFNLDDSNADTQFDTDGTYQFHAERTIDEIRFNFVSEAGGANATLNPAYAGLP